jgi:hypothetical protein
MTTPRLKEPHMADERVRLQRRKVTLVRAIARRTPSAGGIHEAVRDAEAQLTDLLAKTPTATPFSTLDVQGPTR